MGYEVSLEHHLVKSTVLVERVLFGGRQVELAICEERLDLIHVLIFWEQDRRGSHEAAQVPGGCYPVRE